jgi:hypothetical protein
MDSTRRCHNKCPLVMVPSVLHCLTAFDRGEPTGISGSSRASLWSLSIHFGASDEGAWVINFYFGVLRSHKSGSVLPGSVGLVWKDEASVITIIANRKGNCFLTLLLRGLILLHDRHHVVLLFWKSSIPRSIRQSLLGLESWLGPCGSHFQVASIL